MHIQNHYFNSSVDDHLYVAFNMKLWYMVATVVLRVNIIATSCKLKFRAFN